MCRSRKAVCLEAVGHLRGRTGQNRGLISSPTHRGSKALRAGTIRTGWRKTIPPDKSQRRIGER